MDLQIFHTQPGYLENIIKFIVDYCQKKDGDVHIALSGGSAKLVYEAMKNCSDIPFGRVVLWQVDERYVPKDHEHSNYKMIHSTLVGPLDYKLKAFNYFDTSLGIAESLNEYDQLLRKQDVHFDICILGIGPDGHTASIFPQTGTVNEEEMLIAHTQTDVFDVKDRLTITFPMIMKSKKIVVLLKGAGKQDILDQLLSSNKTIAQLPAKKLLDHKDITLFFGNYN